MSPARSLPALAARPMGRSGGRKTARCWPPSPGLFVVLELLSWATTSCHRSMEVGGAILPVLGHRQLVGLLYGHGDAVGGLRPHVRAQQRHGPQTRPSFSTTRHRWEKSLKSHVRIPEKRRPSRLVEGKEAACTRGARSLLGPEAAADGRFCRGPKSEGMQLNNFFSPPPSLSSSPART